MLIHYFVEIARILKISRRLLGKNQLFGLLSNGFRDRGDINWDNRVKTRRQEVALDDRGQAGKAGAVSFPGLIPNNSQPSAKIGDDILQAHVSQQERTSLAALNPLFEDYRIAAGQTVPVQGYGKKTCTSCSSIKGSGETCRTCSAGSILTSNLDRGSTSSSARTIPNGRSICQGPHDLHHTSRVIAADLHGLDQLFPDNANTTSTEVLDLIPPMKPHIASQEYLLWDSMPDIPHPIPLRQWDSIPNHHENPVSFGVGASVIPLQIETGSGATDYYSQKRIAGIPYDGASPKMVPGGTLDRARCIACDTILDPNGLCQSCLDRSSSSDVLPLSSGLPAEVDLLPTDHSIRYSTMDAILPLQHQQLSPYQQPLVAHCTICDGALDVDGLCQPCLNTFSSPNAPADANIGSFFDFDHVADSSVYPYTFQ